jgi:transposase
MMGLEIISGVERRRRWSDADKLRIVAEADEPGAKVAEVARRHEISRSILWTWRKQARAGRLTMSDPLGFLPVLIDAASGMDAPIETAVAPPAMSVQADTPSPPGPLAITITLANGTRLEISAALSLPALSCIIGALR